jgi:hypothetical protein
MAGPDFIKTVAAGTWLYDKSIPKRIEIHARPAKYSATRWTIDDELDESSPIPQTPDGYVYSCFPAKSGEHPTLESAKDWADGQPWGPVKWDD